MLAACLLTLTAGSVATAEGPSADDLFQGHIKAIGGKAALKARTDSTVQARFIIAAAGIDAEMTMRHQAPDRMLVEMNIPGMGEMKQGYNGKIAWMLNPMAGPSLIEGAQLIELKQQADMHADLNYKKYYKDMQAPVEAEFEGMQVYAVKVKTVSDADQTIYFDREKGYIVGNEGTTETEMGPMGSTTVISDYEADGSVLVPRSMRVILTDMGMEQVIKIKSISHDKLDAKTFQLPEEIKALLEAEDA